MARCGTVEFALTAGMVIGGFIMIICGFTVVREYDLSKEFTAVACKVVAVDNLGMLPCDYCVSTRTYSYRKEEYVTERRCGISFFPCVKIHVEYDNPSLGQKVDGLLHSSAVQLYDSFFPQCSYTVCDEFISRNNYYVEKFRKPYQNHLHLNSTFQCYHKSSDPFDLIIAVFVVTFLPSATLLRQGIHYSGKAAFHSMFWPGLLLVGCAIGLLIDLVCSSQCRH